MSASSQRGSTAWRIASWGPGCKPNLVRMLLVHGVWLQIDRRALEAMRALGCVVIACGYKVRQKDTGAYNCRMQKGSTTVPSSHSWGTAVDLNWTTNPYLRDRLVTDMTRVMTDAVCAIGTVDGVQVFRWGGDWDGRPETPHSNYDSMHFEIVATPAELARGIDWATVRMPALSSAETCPPLQLGDRGPAVRRLQERLGVALQDGIFGPITDVAVRATQKQAGLNPDGYVGLGTWRRLLAPFP